MTDALRSRLRMAAQRFADELADAIEEATGERSKVAKKPRRRRPGMRAPADHAPVPPEAQARADAALERVGLVRRKAPTAGRG